VIACCCFEDTEILLMLNEREKIVDTSLSLDDPTFCTCIVSLFAVVLVVCEEKRDTHYYINCKKERKKCRDIQYQYGHRVYYYFIFSQ
jgi:hypothetical protein